MEKTKVAILGAGFIAHIHLESYKRFVHEAEVVAIYARSREKAEAVAAEFGIPGVYDDVDKLLAESGAEVVDVCMPNYTHYEACLKAARSGKHVIVEKPLAWFRWMTGNAKVKSVYSDMKTVFHNDITTCEDNTVTIVEFENGVTAVAEDSWAKHGGMDDRIEVYGDKGVSYADLFRGNSALTYSTEGYDYAMEKAGSTQGWTFTVFEEAFNQGYPQELAHFIHCVRTGEKPLVTGEDGRAVLEMVYAAYASAKEGRKIALPFSAKVKYPIELMR